MTDVLQTELDSINQELEKLKSSLPESLTEDFIALASETSQLSEQIEIETRKVEIRSAQRRTNAPMNPLLYWINKTASNLTSTLGKHQRITHLELQTDLYANTLGIKADDYFIKGEVLRKKRLFKKRIESAKDILAAKNKVHKEIIKNYDAYAVAFENQLASHSLGQVLGDLKNRQASLIAMKSLGEIFTTPTVKDKLSSISVSLNDQKTLREPNSKPEHEIEVSLTGLEKLNISEIHYDVSTKSVRHASSKTLTTIEKPMEPLVEILPLNSDLAPIVRSKKKRNKNRRKAKR